MSNSTLKLHAYLAHLGVAARRKVEAMITAGKILVNGEVAHIGQRINPEKDTVVVNGKTVGERQPAMEYWLVYKPVGYVSSTSDELGRKVVTQLVPSKARLYPVGRLDIDSEGLLLLTNDGDLAHHLTHPSFEIKKTYHALIEGRISAKALDHLERGVKLDDTYYVPDEVKIINDDDPLDIDNEFFGDLPEKKETTWLSITIHQGKYRQVRRMLQRVGYDTLRLIRVQMGPFTLDDLEGEEVVKISPEKVASISSFSQTSNE